MKNNSDLNWVVPTTTWVCLINIYILGLALVGLIIEGLGFSELVTTIMSFIYGFIFGWYRTRIYRFLETNIKHFLLLD